MAETPVPATMRAAAIQRFGGPEEFRVQQVPVPACGPRQLLLQVEAAGLGEWDPFEREGGYAEMTGQTASFPYVLGSEGAGTVVAVGDRVQRFKPGDRVYAASFLNPQGGFYAEYAVVDESLAALLPPGMSPVEAAGLAGVGATALRGLADVLRLERDETIMVFGASGALGHIAMQLARHIGARVLAVASGADGVALVEELGADAAVDGRQGDVEAAARAFAPAGLDAALLAAGGEAAEVALNAMRPRGRVAHPNGIKPEPPRSRAGLALTAYNGELDHDLMARLEGMVAAANLRVHVDRVYPLEQVAQGHQALGRHHLGKLVLDVSRGASATGSRGTIEA